MYCTIHGGCRFYFLCTRPFYNWEDECAFGLWRLKPCSPGFLCASIDEIMSLSFQTAFVYPLDPDSLMSAF